MAVKDLSVLRDELPEVFKDQKLPESWEDDWVVVHVPKPDNPTAILSDDYQLEESTLFDGLDQNTDRISYIAENLICPPYDDIVTAESLFEEKFPGSPQGFPSKGGYLPPPDFMAFYLPFHYYYPHQWGIYILLEGQNWLVNLMHQLTENILSHGEALGVARVFLYSHEFFHHIVESFATRLETTHRVPVYKAGFQKYFNRTQGTDDCIEEGLATAYAYKKVKEKCLKNDSRQAVVLSALVRYIESLPPGYRIAKDYLNNREFDGLRFQFSEDNHLESFPKIPGKSPQLWRNSPHAFHGFANVKSRVSYIIPVGSPLINRMKFGRPLNYRQFTKKLVALAGLKPTTPKKKGGHPIWITPNGKRIPIPNHSSDLGLGLMAKIIKQVGLEMSYKEFVAAGT